MVAAKAAGWDMREASGEPGAERPPGRSLDPRRLKPVPARLSLSLAYRPSVRRSVALTEYSNFGIIIGEVAR
jgi:hypothetical protein